MLKSSWFKWDAIAKFRRSKNYKQTICHSSNDNNMTIKLFKGDVTDTYKFCSFSDKKVFSDQILLLQLSVVPTSKKIKLNKGILLTT